LVKLYSVLPVDSVF